MSAVTVPSWESLRGFVVVGSVLASLVVLFVLTRDEHRADGVRSRLLHGVPWGTLLTVLFVLSVYLFVQGGLAHPRRPLVVPFRSWSYFYPVGMLTAAFSHSSWGHLVGNLVGTVAYASVAEYAWGHYPRERGVQTFSSLWTNPYVRILVVPCVSIVVGLFTSLFALGPVVGFSGVVFAYAGFAFVRRPLLAALAILGARILNMIRSGVLTPRSVTSPSPRVVTPWWTDIAIQGHAIGLFAGVLLGIALARSRDEWADPRRLWFGLVAFAAFQGLWAVYVPGDSGRYVLFRWAGVSLLFVLATVVVVAATRSRESRVPTLDGSGRTVAIGCIAVILVALSGSAVFYNVAPLDRQDGPEPAVEVRGYSVGYAENYEDRYVGAVTVPFVNYSPEINTSGVIVTNDRRYVWQTMVGSTQLEHRGRASVLLGGLGWRERVYANRTGWNLAGGGDVYQVYLRPGGGDRTLAFSSEPATADPVIAGRNVSMRPVDERFEFVVSREGEQVDTVLVPDNGSVVDAGGIRLRRNGSIVYAIDDGTRVAIAQRTGNGYSNN